MDAELKVAIFGIVAILFLEGFALYQGLNGVMFGSAMVGVGGVIGWVFKSYRHKHQKWRN